ncbi:histidine phosphotransferase family protein [Terasakiella sp. SH-1]|uniref:histidine phosphotransferase family protein n=1 Tax=Terasakiella sp. SH-1 TaxID=2560057 RepID=UPI0010734CB0|nr:histidine phosphotransferase family protein [Terasakiella sp. SH-1]
MGVQVDMRVAELLCSRLCHDLVGPVGAVNHGIELIEETNSPVMAEAAQMIGQSGQQAASRLEFFRLAFGLSGGGSGRMSMLQGRQLAQGFIEKHIQLHWPQNPELPWKDNEPCVPKDVIKVILNLLMLGIDCLPRGGTLTLNQAALPEGLGIALVCEGQKAHIKDEIQSAIAPNASCDSLTARTVQAFFMARLADDLGLDFEISCPQADYVQIAALIPLDL